MSTSFVASFEQLINIEQCKTVIKLPFCSRTPLFHTFNIPWLPFSDVNHLKKVATPGRGGRDSHSGSLSHSGCMDRSSIFLAI